MSTLRITGLRKRFDDIHAVDGLNLNVESGEFFALLGPSASGKTTSLRIIAGITPPDEGSIFFDGRNITHDPIQGRSMAMVFQNFALYPHLTVFENLAFPLRESRLAASGIKTRVAEISEQLRLTHTLQRKPATLSGGEQQRVAIGRALIRRPKLLLLDEPLTNLDAKLRHDTRAEFKRLHRELGLTLVYATPDELEALSMGQRIGVLNAGRIEQTGTPDELYERPETQHVARMVGSPTMNLFPGIFRKHARAPVVELGFMEVMGGAWESSLTQFPVGTEVLFGIRPQDLTPLEGDASGPNFNAEVRMVEPLGGVTVVDLTAMNVPFKISLQESSALRYRVGDHVRLQFDLSNSHLFSKETGTAIRQ